MRWPLTDPKSRNFSGFTAFLLHSRMLRDVAWLRPGPFNVVNEFLSPFRLLEANAHDEWFCCFCVKLQDALCVSYLEENSVDSVWERDEFVCEGAKILEQEPYVAVLEAGAQNKRCDRCYTKSSTVKRCSACKSVFYCCADCQVIASVVPVPLGVLGLRATL